MSSQDNKISKSVSPPRRAKAVEKKQQSKESNETGLSSRDRKVIKSVSGRMLWEEGYGTGECPGMTSPVPRWFVDFRSEGRLRVNCMT